MLLRPTALVMRRGAQTLLQFTRVSAPKQKPIAVLRSFSDAAAAGAVDPLGLDGVIVTKRCGQKIEKLNSSDNGSRYLRLAVDSGGCSGFQYSFEVSRCPSCVLVAKLMLLLKCVFVVRRWMTVS